MVEGCAYGFPTSVLGTWRLPGWHHGLEKHLCNRIDKQTEDSAGLSNSYIDNKLALVTEIQESPEVQRALVGLALFKNSQEYNSKRICVIRMDWGLLRQFDILIAMLAARRRGLAVSCSV